MIVEAVAPQAERDQPTSSELAQRAKVLDALHHAPRSAAVPHVDQGCLQCTRCTKGSK